MPIDDDLLRQLLALFTVEAEEHLQTINHDLLALEQQPDPPRAQELLADIFRAAHTLKGSARSINLESVGALSHRLETLFGNMQKGELRPTQSLFDLIYESLDAIAALVRASANGARADVDVGALDARLTAAAAPPAVPGDGPRVVDVPPRPEKTYAVAAASDLPQSVQPRASARSEPAEGLIAQTPPAVRPPAAEQAGAGIEPTVRIATGKLDALMAQLGELQVNRISAEQRLSDLRALLEGVEAWEAEWRKVRVPFRRLLPALAEDGAEHAAPPATGGDTRDLGHVIGFVQANEAHLRLMRARLADLQRAMLADSRQLAQVTGDLQDDVRRTRMMPAAVVFDTFPRMVRDLAHELNKEVMLDISGADTEVDRTLLEQIKGPLLHLLRNAIDHGIEAPEERVHAGKPRTGRVLLAAAQRGSHIVIEVADDGAGIDPARVRAGALKRELLTPEAAAALSDQEALWLIFRSGLSTRALITDVSGRGVGLDVVRENVERLQGQINVESRIGYGTRFILQLPLTIATTLCLLAETAGQTFALPVANMTRVMHVRPADIGHAQGRQTVRVNGRPVVLTLLADLLALGQKPAEPVPGKQPVIILGSLERQTAVMVDALHGAQEVVVKRLPRPFARVQHVAGAAIMGTGAVVLILNVADMLRSAGRLPAAPLQMTAPETARRSAVIIIAEDSITTRTLEKNILEAAGYRVRAAADGMEAWTLLQSEPCDLLVSDIQMPRMDGFTLTQQVRADERLKQLPVVLVTALASREDRERGIHVGADAYIVKSAFDQDMLLSTIRQLI